MPTDNELVKEAETDDTFPTEQDDLEKGDGVGPLKSPGFVPPARPTTDDPMMTRVPRSRPRRTKAVSDIVEMVNDLREEDRKRDRKKTVSDIHLLVNIPSHVGATRVRSSSDVVKLFSDPSLLLGGADIRMAAEIAEVGAIADRPGEKLLKIDPRKADELPDGFELNTTGLTSEEAARRLEEYGRNELPEHVDPKWLIFLRLLWAPMPIMIWIAIVIEIAISNYIDMAILLAIQLINASIGYYETTKAGDAVAALKSSLKPTATVKRDGKWIIVEGAVLVPGDMVLLGSGSAIPADCRVNRGEIDVDQAALTGESLPVTFYKGDSCKMGSTVVRGETEATVEHTGANTFFGKTASLLVDHHELSRLQKVLIQIMIYLVTVSVLLCSICFIYLLIEGESVDEALSFTVVLLVASIPLAMEIVTTTTLAIGSKELVHHGAIVAKLTSIEDLAGMSILCSDKTGTLTRNEMVIQDDTPTYMEGLDQKTILLYAAQAAKWHEPPRDALDRLTLGAVDMSLLEPFEQLEFIPFDPTVKRTEGTVKDTRTGQIYKTTKGAPHIILGLLKNSMKVCDAVERDVARLGQSGIRSLAVAKTDPQTGEWQMAGLLTFLDPPREDTKQTVADAHRLGIAVKMITGDHLLIAKSTAKALEMGDRIFNSEGLPMLEEGGVTPADLSKNYGDICLAADGFAQVFPEHKYLIVECLREMGFTTGMTGDGVNDSPALKRADVGIAVAGATDAARAAADIVLTAPGLGTIIHGIEIARRIFMRINNFITYRVAATLQLLVFFFIAIFAFHPADYEQPPPEELQRGEPWPEFFQLPVIMLMVITVLNDGTLITIGYDNAEASSTPCKWNLPAVFVASSVLGMVSCFSSLLLLYFLLDSWNTDGFIQQIGMSGIQYGQIISAIYLKISVSDFLTLFCARTGDRFFWMITPSTILLCGGAFALSASSIISIVWPESEPDGILVKGLKDDMGLFGFVWIYCILFFFLQDVMKVQCYKWMHKVNFNRIATTGVVILPESTLKLIEELDNAAEENPPVAHH